MKFKPLEDVELLSLRRGFPDLGFLRTLGRKMNDTPAEELSENRRKLVAAHKRMLDGIRDREMNAEESAASDASLKMLENIDAELEGRAEGFGRHGDRSGSFHALHTPENAQRRPAMTFVDSQGQEVRALRPDESLASTLRRSEFSDGGARDLSLGRLVKAAVTGDWKGADAEFHAMGGNATLGGYLIPDELSAQVIDLARNMAVVFRAGAQTVPMGSSELKLAKLLKDPGVAWKVENKPGTSTDLSFGALTLSAKTLMALCSASVELVEDAANLDEVVRNSLAQALALELDRAALRGDGTGASPVGVRNAKGVQIIDLGAPAGAVLANYDPFSQAVENIATKNGTARTVIFAPRTAGTLDRLKEATTNAPLAPPPSFAALDKLVTNQIPIDLAHGTADNGSEAYVGDFEQLLVGMRTSLTIEISRQAGDDTGGAFRNLQVWIRAYLRADVSIARPPHFCVIDGIVVAG